MRVMLAVWCLVATVSSALAQNIVYCRDSVDVVGLNASAGGLLNVRTGPSVGFPALAHIRIGDLVEACDISNGWTRIRYGDSAIGWVSSRFLAPVSLMSGTGSANAGSNGFRPGERLEHTAATSYSHAFRTWSGRADDLHYRYHDDASGSVGAAPGALSSLWSIECRIDAMTDDKSCSLHDKDGALFLTMTSKRHVRICAMGHDFPGRQAMLRFDSEPAVNLGEGGCSSDDTSIDEVLRARKIAVRSYKWPYDYRHDRSVNLNGLPLAVDLARFLWERKR